MLSSPKAEDDEDSIHTEIDYLVKDPKHEYEKPYEIRYDTGGLIPERNMVDVTTPVVVHNFRPLQSPEVNCVLTPAEFGDDEKVRAVYYPAIEKLLWIMFPDASNIKILGHGVCALVHLLSTCY
ncbi:hypothetical protein V2W45_1427243 [Cenococcum geophilum]